MTSVGERPRQREGSPSFRAILRRPSSVEVKFFRRVSSTAHSAEEVVVVWENALMAGEDDAGVARQYSALLLTQNTSLQQAVTPRFGGTFVNGRGMCDETDVGRDAKEV